MRKRRGGARARGRDDLLLRRQRAYLGEVVREAVVVVDDDDRPPVVLHQRRGAEHRSAATLRRDASVSPMPTPRAPSALRRAARTEDAAEDAEVEVIVKADMVSEDR